MALLRADLNRKRRKEQRDADDRTERRASAGADAVSRHSDVLAQRDVAREHQAMGSRKLLADEKLGNRQQTFRELGEVTRQKERAEDFARDDAETQKKDSEKRRTELLVAHAGESASTFDEAERRFLNKGGKDRFKVRHPEKYAEAYEKDFDNLRQELEARGITDVTPEEYAFVLYNQARGIPTVLNPKTGKGKGKDKGPGDKKINAASFKDLQGQERILRAASSTLTAIESAVDEGMKVDAIRAWATNIVAQLPTEIQDEFGLGDIVSKEWSTMQSALENVGDLFARSRSGAAITASEFERFFRILGGRKLNEETLINTLAAFVQQSEQDLVGNREQANALFQVPPSILNLDPRGSQPGQLQERLGQLAPVLQAGKLPGRRERIYIYQATRMVNPAKAEQLQAQAAAAETPEQMAQVFLMMAQLAAGGGDAGPVR